jgi:hypothetical protein
MGSICSICSKSSNLTGGHTLASSSPAGQGQSHATSAPGRQRPQAPDARRSQAAAAAEERKKAVSTPVHEPNSIVYSPPQAQSTTNAETLSFAFFFSTFRKPSGVSALPILVQDGSPPVWKRQRQLLLSQNRPGGKTRLS